MLIGDVQGKGVEAAAISGLARHTVRAAPRFQASPATLLQHLNTAIIDNVLESAAESTDPGQTQSSAPQRCLGSTGTVPSGPQR